MSELAFGHRTAAGDDVKIGVLVGSVIAGVLASLVLLSRNAAYRRIHLYETADTDHDGVPDIYESRRDRESRQD
jgi:NhaA family Na+:H+ antiporter